MRATRRAEPGASTEPRFAGTSGVRGLASVVIVNFESGPLLAEAVGSVLASDCPVDVIVVDNASTDDSLETALSVHGRDDRLRTVRNAENLGFARACNQGLAMAQGEYLLLLNPDARLAPHSIRELGEALAAFPGAGMAGPLLLNPDGTEQAGGRRRLPTPGRAWIQAFGLRRLAKISAAAVRQDFIQAELPLPAAPVEVEAISGACTLVHRAALADVGGLDEGYFLHCEDLDWCHRFRRAGWRIVFVPDIAVVHDKGACSHARPLFVQWHLHRGMVRYYRKFLLKAYPAPLFALVVAGIWGRFAALVPVVSLYQAFAPRRRWIAQKGNAAREL